MDDEAARLKAERKAEKKRKREEEAAKAGAAEAPAEVFASDAKHTLMAQPRGVRSGRVFAG